MVDDEPAEIKRSKTIAKSVPRPPPLEQRHPAEDLTFDEELPGSPLQPIEERAAVQEDGGGSVIKGTISQKSSKKHIESKPMSA